MTEPTHPQTDNTRATCDSQPNAIASTSVKLRILLICHHDAPLNHQGLGRWLASFSDLVGIVVLEEKPEAIKRRIRFEINRVGFFGFLDGLAFRLYYRLLHSSRDSAWEADALGYLKEHFPVTKAPLCHSESPNTKQVENFIRAAAPDIVIARSKHLIREQVFSIPRQGTLVMHPGICPEYRNAHGCFWALANNDLERVGMTLLKIDKGIDTGPVYGYYSYNYDELSESHRRIQWRCVLENLGPLAEKIRQIGSGSAQIIDTKGRASAIWGQPLLSKYAMWKWRARRRAKILSKAKVRT